MTFAFDDTTYTDNVEYNPDTGDYDIECPHCGREYTFDRELLDWFDEPAGCVDCGNGVSLKNT